MPQLERMDVLNPPGGADSGLLTTRPPDHRIEGAVEGVMRAVQMEPGTEAGQTDSAPFILGFCLLIATGAALCALLLGGGFEHGIHPVRVFIATCVFVMIWSGLGFTEFGVPFSLAVAPLMLPLTAGAAVIIYGR